MNKKGDSIPNIEVEKHSRGDEATHRSGVERVCERESGGLQGWIRGPRGPAKEFRLNSVCCGQPLKGFK